MPAVAEVDGKEITSEELESALAVQLGQLEEQIYQLKRQQLEALIAERLLAQAATQRGFTVQALIETEVNAKTAPVTDQEIDAFYQANKAQLGALDAGLSGRIKTYLQGQRLTARREEFLQSLRAKAKVVVALSPPMARIKIPIEGAPFRGKADAPVTIVEFSDFHCPFCSKVQPTLKQVLAKYGDRVKLVYRHMPIDQLHPQARQAAEAAACAYEQGKFWEYHDLLYANGPNANPEKLKGLAQSAGLNVQTFDQCLLTGKQKQEVQKDLAEASRLGINGTPAFFINGRMLTGAQPLEGFARVIDDELARQGNSQANNVEKRGGGQN